MFRGTTPTFNLNISEVSLDTLERIYVTVHQDKDIDFTKTNEDLEFNYEDNIIYFTLTEKETFKLQANDKPAYIQVRAVTNEGSVLATNPVAIPIKDVYYKRLISNQEG